MTAATRPRRKTGWLIYASALTVAVVVGELNRGTAPDATAFASWIFTAVLLVALWSYALQRPVGHERYWRAVFWVVLVASLLMLVPILLAGGPLAKFTLALVVPVVPAYLAAYRYAYRSGEIWKKRLAVSG